MNVRGRSVKVSEVIAAEDIHTQDAEAAAIKRASDALRRRKAQLKVRRAQQSLQKAQQATLQAVTPSS